MAVGTNLSRYSSWDTRADEAWRQPALRYIYQPCIEKAGIFPIKEMGKRFSGRLCVLKRYSQMSCNEGIIKFDNGCVLKYD